MNRREFLKGLFSAPLALVGGGVVAGSVANKEQAQGEVMTFTYDCQIHPSEVQVFFNGVEQEIDGRFSSPIAISWKPCDA